MPGESPLKSLCFVTTSPLIVNFFLVPHLLRLRQHYRVTLAVTLPGEAPLRELPGVEVLGLTIERRIAPWRDLASLRRLTALFAARRFGAVHSFGPKAGLLCTWAGRRAGVPVRVHTYTGQVWASRRGLMRQLLRAADRSTARNATHLFADSASQKEFLVRERIVPPEKCLVLGSGSVSGVDLARFRADRALGAQVRKELGIDEAAVVVLYLGRLNRDKGVLDLAQAFARVREDYPAACVVFVGPDEQGLRDEILRACGAHASAVRFSGYTPSPERYLAAADVLCLPSYREGFGSVVIEGAAAGVPAVASRIYGVTDAVAEGETGVLFEPGNIDDLSRKLTALIADPAARERLGRAARERATKLFAEERLTGALADFYARVLS